MSKKRLILVHLIWRESYSAATSREFRGKWDWAGETGEAFNFLPHTDGKCWGYMAMNAGGKWWPKLTLEKIEHTARGKPAVNGVTIAFTAPDPQGGDRVIVGWYQDASVYREPIVLNLPNREADRYYLVANSRGCVELRKDKRKFKILGAQRARAQGISGSYPGHSPVFYASHNNPKLTDKIMAYIAGQVAPASRPMSIDPDLLRNAMAATGTSSEIETIEHALRTLLHNS
jgi:hypothetical protein